MFPYLLRDLKVTRPNQVWATDITYIPIQGRCIDKVFIERLWWSVKYEDAYIREYKDGKELHLGMQWYFQKYNFERRHAGIEHDLPCNRYFIDKTA